MAKLIAKARKGRHGPGIYYLGGYCDNTTCDVRDVMVRVKDYDLEPSLKEFRCPACRSMLLTGSMEFGVEVLTDQQMRLAKEQDARDSVAAQIHEERMDREGRTRAWLLSDIPMGASSAPSTPFRIGPASCCRIA